MSVFQTGYIKKIIQLEEWLKELPERNAKHYSIYEKDLGYCGETFYEMANGTAIMDIKLLPKAQGRGIGQTALQFAIEQAFRVGAKQAIVNPFEINKKSIHLYKKLGFKEVRRVRQMPSDLVLPCEYTIDMV